MSGFLDNLPGVDNRARKRKQPPPVLTTDKVVRYHIVHCPECNSDQCRVYSTKRPLRYHICHECGALFKSVEQ